VIVAGTFEGKLGVQRPDKVHHFSTPVTAFGTRDAFIAAFSIRDGRDAWTTSLGGEDAVVSDLLLGMSRVSE